LPQRSKLKLVLKTIFGDIKMNEAAVSQNQFAWIPDEETKRKAQLTKFLSQCGVDSFEKLYEHSVEDVEWFTEEVLKFLDIQFDPPYTKLLDTSRGWQWSRWCVDGGLNIASHCVDRYLGTDTENQPAVIWEGEEGATRTLTYKELNEQVEYCAAGLRELGLGKGDAIGIHLPMMPETVIALIAIARIGAIAVPIFSGYGVTAIESRLQDVGARGLITCDGFPRRSSIVNAKQTANQAVERCPQIQNVIVVERSNNDIEMQDGRDITWSELITKGETADPSFKDSEPTNAEDPLIVLYTSGTTGKPKGIAHTHCGFPIKSAQDMAFGTDVGVGTRISWVTDIGWMMGPWLIYGTLILGGTIVLYDGAPDYPNAGRMWEFCAKHKVEILGISPTLVRALAANGDELPNKHDLSSLRAFGSTGEPWNPDPWWWLFEKVGQKKIPIINYSGGTEISGGILMGNPLLPIKPCSFSAPCPGMAAVILDENGKEATHGAIGELALTKPWIGMARGFWKDPERYLETYFSRFENVWVHGDWAQVDENGHWYILGRSDDTLKVAGKRVGPAEVESILVAHESVIEAAVIGVPDELKGTALVAFCVVANDANANEKLIEQLREMVGAELGKPLRPSKILFVNALPKTRNAKVMRRVIRAAYLGEDAGDLSALENPQAVEEIKSQYRLR
jgi:acetyl-CoA synthetase